MYLLHSNFYNSLIRGFEVKPGTAFSFLLPCDQQHHCKQTARRREDLTCTLLSPMEFSQSPAPAPALQRAGL